MKNSRWVFAKLAAVQIDRYKDLYDCHYRLTISAIQTSLESARDGMLQTYEDRDIGVLSKLTRRGYHLWGLSKAQIEGNMIAISRDKKDDAVSALHISGTLHRRLQGDVRGDVGQNSGTSIR